MKTTPRCPALLASLVLGLLASPGPTVAATETVVDASSALGRTEAPVSLAVRLGRRQLKAAREGRLGTQPAEKGLKPQDTIPVQWEFLPGSNTARATWLVPAGAAGQRHFAWRRQNGVFPLCMKATQDPVSGQVDLTEDSLPVLRYNYRTIEPGGFVDQVSEGNRIYARARSDYIHPLYGLKGEVLTRDWSPDHPHHRGIYWAWPEVNFGKERGDLHALQKVFARPTGKLSLASGPVFAQVEAENLWLWEDREPIVREHAVIRAYRATPRGRIVDLCFQFLGLKDGVTVARRDTTHYGGLNIRLASPPSQAITVHADPRGSVPRRAWSDLSGVFRGPEASGLSVLQNAANPEYPGDWVQYPELSWCQPTFPTAGTRYALAPGRPLVLRFRLWVHSGTAPDATWMDSLWDAWHAPDAATPTALPPAATAL